MPDDPAPLITNPLVVVQPTEGGAVLMNSATGDCYELNRTGAEIWRRLSGGETQETILTTLSGSYGISRDVLETDMRVLVTDLVSHGLLTLPVR